ncbi:8757_t:CDS:2 [Ambispora gerdemannii]|uniref:8757_t:CDS:1 n=1 Tax=Ambispora gerdemannii TaxID=144530 RepID=A0A9N9C1T5_9GLOM|nr:8757_t:CDS:2 [Ambispora gerdemannii]
MHLIKPTLKIISLANFRTKSNNTNSISSFLNCNSLPKFQVQLLYGTSINNNEQKQEQEEKSTLSSETTTLDFRTPGEKHLYEKLREKFNPSRLIVHDISGGCGEMYAIEIASSAFSELSMIKQHRLVNEALKDDIAKMHGVQLKTSAK